MKIQDAQNELRVSFVNGGPGAVVSGLIWLAAGFVASQSAIPAGFGLLFFGGMLIFPISLLVVRFVFRRPAPSHANPGGRTVVETVFPMIGGLFAAWLLMPHRPEFVFPMSAIAVGTHYFGFRTAYGDPVYWVLGGIMSIVGVGTIVAGMPAPAAVPFLIGGIEIVFGIALTVLNQSATRPKS